MFLFHRDREVEIARIEEDRHKLREKKHGKNYLLETYLNGLHEAVDDDQLIVTGINSDSGVNTEETIPTSPEIGQNQQKRKVRSHREQDLLKEHESIKELGVGLIAEDDKESGDQIDVLQKIIVLNKRLQHEEELIIRLNAKIKRYQSDNKSLNEVDIKDAIERINTDINRTNDDFVAMGKQLNDCDLRLNEKNDILERLSLELNQIDDQNLQINPNNSNNQYGIVDGGDEDRENGDNANNDDDDENADVVDVLISPPPQFQTITSEVQIHSTPKHHFIQKYTDNNNDHQRKINNNNNVLFLTNSNKTGPKKFGNNGIMMVEQLNDMTMMGTLV